MDLFAKYDNATHLHSHSHLHPTLTLPLALPLALPRPLPLPLPLALPLHLPPNRNPNPPPPPRLTESRYDDDDSGTIDKFEFKEIVRDIKARSNAIITTLTLTL